MKTKEDYFNHLLWTYKKDLMNTETMWIDEVFDNGIVLTGNSYSLDRIYRNYKGIVKLAKKVKEKFNDFETLYLGDYIINL